MQKKVLIFVIISVILGGCSTAPKTIQIDTNPNNQGKNVNFDKTTFVSEWKLWEGQNIGTYSFVKEMAFTTMPSQKVRIYVKDNMEIYVEDLNINRPKQTNPGQEYIPWQFGLINTISSLYTWLANQFESIIGRIEDKNFPYRDRYDGFKAEIIYNKQYHYPEQIQYRVIYSSKEYPDSAVTIMLSDFRLNHNPEVKY